MRYMLSIAIGLISFVSNAQNWTLDALESEIYQYTDLDEALNATKDSVFSLKLKERLKEVPPEVFTEFPNLQWLDLSKNRLKEIPPQLGLLKKLKKLILFKNRIEALPAEIGELEDLRELIVNQNELETLPEEIGNLKKLRYIDMWSNNITGLPGSMAEMWALQEVDLRVIVMTEAEQEYIRDMLPEITVHMDEHCNCGN
jgi:Leucine-rich repeat (LRR) protein